MKKLSKKELIRALEAAEKCPRDLGGRIGEFGIVGLSGAGSAALASALLTTTVTTSVTAPVLGSTLLGGLLGASATVTTLVAAPVWAVVAGAAGGVLVTQGILRIVRSGARNDKIREDYISALRKKVATCEESLAATDNSDLIISKLAGVYAVLLRLNAVSIEEVQSLFSDSVLEMEVIASATNKAKSVLVKYDQTACK